MSNKDLRMNTDISDDPPWVGPLRAVLRARQSLAPDEFIARVAQLSATTDGATVDAYLDSHDWWREHREAVIRLYYSHIVEMETAEVVSLMARPASTGLVPYADMASERGRVSYERVGDMFRHVDFARCQRFVMVGCGQLPVTALHVMAVTAVPDIVVVDISEAAIEAVQRLSDRFGWRRLRAVHQAGHLLDYRGADVIYLANMISPKSAALHRALLTAPAHAQIVLREPYALGRLWAEKAEPGMPPTLRVAGRGPVSGHLSRDPYLERTQG